MPPLVLIERNWFRSLFSRFTVETVTASRKSDRSFIGVFLPDWFSEIYQFFWNRSNSSDDGQYESFSCANLSISMHVSSVQPIFSCESRKTVSRWKRSWIPSNFFLRHLLRALRATKCFFSAFSFAVPSTTRSLLLDDVVLDWEGIQSPLVRISAGLILSQEMHTSAINDALIPVQKAFWALHFWNCFA